MKQSAHLIIRIIYTLAALTAAILFICILLSFAGNENLKPLNHLQRNYLKLVSDLDVLNEAIQKINDPANDIFLTTNYKLEETLYSTACKDFETAFQTIKVSCKNDPLCVKNDKKIQLIKGLAKDTALLKKNVVKTLSLQKQNHSAAAMRTMAMADFHGNHARQFISNFKASYRNDAFEKSEHILLQQQWYQAIEGSILAILLLAFLVVLYRSRKNIAEYTQKNKSNEVIKLALEEFSIATIHDENGTMAWVSEKFCDLVKYSERELLGKNYMMLHENLHSEAFFNEIGTLLRQKRTWQGLISLKDKEGKTCWTLCCVTALEKLPNEKQHYLSISQDITQIVESEDKFHALFEESSEAQCILSQEHILESNQAAKKLFLGENTIPATEDFCIGSPFSSFAPEYQPDGSLSQDKLEAMLLLAKKKGSTRFDWQMQNMKGEPIETVIGITCITLGGATNYVTVIHDLTERKMNEEKIRLALIQKESAELASQSKSEFLANMSHEIRTPMNGVIGMAQLLQRTGLNDEQDDYVQTLLKSSQHLMGIINDILDFSKIEAGKMEVETTALDLNDIYSDLRRYVEANRQDKPIEFKLDIAENVPDLIMGDPKRLRQIIFNLTNNALKFTQFGWVQLSVQALESPDPNENETILKFSIEDTGIGISKENLKRVFSQFTQADESTTRQYGGSGLGLSISQSLVKLMGGEMGVSSEDGKGSCFSFTIKTRECYPDDLAALKQSNLSGGGLFTSTPQARLKDMDFSQQKILLVEDNLINQKVALKMLENQGIVAEVANNGREAIEKLQAQKYDLVLMDCHMPEMDGYEATRRIRQMSGDNQFIPIIALTANALSGEREKCLSAGMVDYLSKPITSESIHAVVTNWLNTSDYN